MRRILAMLALTIGALVLVPVASAGAATVSGQCTIAGTASFSPNGLTATPQTLTYSFGGNGTCTGTLNGTPIISAPVSANATGSGTLSCAAAVSTGGTGTLSFPNQGVSVGFHIDLVGVGSEVALSITGNTGGNGTGRASFGSNAARAAECASPTGVNNLGFDVQAGAVNLAG
jgi:hypothetical protein